MGKGLENLLVIMAKEDGTGSIICVNGSGETDDSLCPCCMLPETRQRIMEAVSKMGIVRLTWKSIYSHAIPEYFPSLWKSAEGEFSVVDPP
jgi:hypothetical protein